METCIAGRRMNHPPRRIASYRAMIDKLVVKRKMVIEQVKTEEDELKKAEKEVVTTEKAQVIVQHIAQTLQQKAHKQIASVVSRCLETVFEEPYEFNINFERKRGKTEARLQFIRDGLVLDDPLNEAGGGPVDVAAFALRLACILLSRPQKRRLVVLDEPFKNIRGRDNKNRTRQMLLKLAEEMKIQFIINTEIESYQLGKVVELS
jgi:hypothetical protein